MISEHPVFSRRASSRRHAGFSLIELIVVISIIAIIAVFTAPNAAQILRGSNMNQAASMLTDQLRLARDVSIAQNCKVEVRFFQFADPEVPGENPSDPTTGQYRALQAFQVTSGGSVESMLPLDKVQKLPTNVCIYCTDKNHSGASEAYSTILSTINRGITQQTPSAANGDAPLLGVGMNYTYIAFRFNPGGSTNLPWVATGPTPPAWFITINNANDQGYMTNKMPINFCCVQIDPVSGSTKTFRPMVGG